MPDRDRRPHETLHGRAGDGRPRRPRIRRPGARRGRRLAAGSLAACASAAPALAAPALAVAASTAPLLAAPAWAQEAPADTAAPAVGAATPDTAPRDTTALRQRIQEILDEHGAPGAGVALASADGPVWVAGIGIADRATNRPVTPATVFRAGSISKSFVALAALRLVEEGRLDLDTPAREIVPEVQIENPWAETDPVRLVHLLEHTSGLDDIHLVEYSDMGPDITLLEALTDHPDSKVVRWRPGTRYSYSNSGPAIVAYAIEKVTGRRFEDHVRETFFEPLGMLSTDFLYTDTIAATIATGYRGDGRTVAPYVHIGVRPSGSLNTTPGDLARLVALLLGRGTLRGIEHLPAPAIERMETPTTAHTARAGIRVGYGLGNYTSIQDGFIFHGHNGGIDGFTASYGYLPEAGMGYVALVNAQSGATGEIARELRRYIIGDRKAAPPGAVVEVPSERLESLAGYYEPVSPRNEIQRFLSRIFELAQVRFSEGRLSIAGLGGPARALIPGGENLFRTPNAPEPNVVFLEVDGRTVLQGPGSIGTYVRIPAAAAWLRRIVAAGSLLLMLSSLLFALVWTPRALFGKLRRAPHLGVRALPALAAASLLAGVLVFAFAGADPGRIMRPTVWSVGFYLLTLVFTALTIAAVVRAARAQRERRIHRVVRIHSLAVAVACLIVMLYLGYYGVLGIRLWSY